MAAAGGGALAAGVFLRIQYTWIAGAALIAVTVLAAFYGAIAGQDVIGGAPLFWPSGMMVCTEPLPNERVPMMVARLWSCSAPATISEAEAEPPLINTTSGMP